MIPVYNFTDELHVNSEWLVEAYELLFLCLDAFEMCDAYITAPLWG